MPKRCNHCAGRPPDSLVIHQVLSAVILPLLRGPLTRTVPEWCIGAGRAQVPIPGGVGHCCPRLAVVVGIVAHAWWWWAWLPTYGGCGVGGGQTLGARWGGTTASSSLICCAYYHMRRGMPWTIIYNNNAFIIIIHIHLRHHDTVTFSSSPQF